MKLSPKFKIGVILVLMVAIFVILNLTGFSKEIKNFFYLTSEPIQKTLWRTGGRVSDFFEMISETKNLKKENEELTLEIQALLSENARLKELKKENEILREALGIGLEKDFKLILAQVIGKDVSQDSLLINKGFQDGISKGLPVITQQKTLVGKIGEVYENFSKIMLLTNKESSFDAKISDSDIYGMVKGKGDLGLFLDLIPKEKEIKEGDFIITIPLGGVFPEGLLAGEIKKVKKSDVEPFQQAEIKPSFDIKEIEDLFVITEFLRH